MFATLAALIIGLVVLVWSADRFVEGAATAARHLGMSPLLIGMVVIGFGTSAPEIVVSALASWQGNPGIALGNAYGSNITNIGLILGLTALISPIAVHSQVLRRELPILIGITLLAVVQLWDLELSRADAWILLGVFAMLMAWSIRQGTRGENDSLGSEMAQELATQSMPLRKALVWLVAGLLLLILSSRVLVWGAVEVAQSLGVSDLIIGLTVVAVGTSLPELASSLIALRKGEHDIALGNVLGSNLFNTLAVVGIAGAIHPLAVQPALISRDMLTMGCLTLALFLFCYGFRGPGRINRVEGGLLLGGYAAYNAWLISGLLG